jgi:hypothetical protein
MDLHFAYAQARVQARFAGLPPESEWQRLAASRTLAAFLEEARAGIMRDWIKGFSGQSGIQDLEAGLRVLYRNTLDEVAGWVPAPWQEAVSWVRWLPRLPLMSHLQAGGPVPGWVARDQELGVLIAEDGTLDHAYLIREGAEALTDPRSGLIRSWIAEWRGRWPSCARSHIRGLEALTDLLGRHAEAFARLQPTAAWHQRRALRERLRLRLHQQALRPEVPFVYLASLALDLERLRAALVSRALFPQLEEPAPADAPGKAA